MKFDQIQQAFIFLHVHKNAGSLAFSGQKKWAALAARIFQ